MLSRHAETRCQQRGIGDEVLSVLLDFGSSRHRHGAEVYFMDKVGRRSARAALGRKRYAQIANRLNTYVVVSHDGMVLTAAQRRRRLKFS